MDGDKNVPHMHLFLLLKRQFPELRDADVTDCIQRFGLNKELCEKELTRRINDQQKIYYSPWSPRRSSSRSADASPTSSSAMPLTNGDASSLTSIVLSDDVRDNSPQSAPVYANSNPFICQPRNRRKSAELLNESRKLGVLKKLSERNESEDDVHTPSTDRSASSLAGSRSETASSPRSSALSSNTMSSPSQFSEASSRDADVAIINEQLEKKCKLEGQLKFRKEEQIKLEQEIKILKENHEGKENDQIRDMDDYRKRIDNLTKENNFLLSDCEILEQKLGEFSEKLADLSNLGEPSAAQRPRVSSSTLPSYTNRHQDINHLPDEVEHDWACCKCTFLNHATLSQCEICGFGNFTRGGSEHESCYCHRRFDYDHVTRSPVRNS